MIPESYLIVRGCHNCKHVFKYFDWDEHNAYYCMLNSPPRPLCGSSAEHEEFLGSKKLIWEAWLAWEAWSDPRSVHPCGFCIEWKDKI